MHLIHTPAGVAGTGGYPGARAWALDRFDRAAKASFCNHDLVRASSLCGCYYCLSIFPAAAVDRWCDGPRTRELTAMCPKCGIDGVLPDAAGLPVDRAFLETLRGREFVRATG